MRHQARMRPDEQFLPRDAAAKWRAAPRGT
jgi:hypothetical protein